MPKLKHFDNLGTARFLTFSCYRNQKYFLDQTACELLANNLDLARTKHCFKLWGYVIMPEHVHIVMMPPHDMKLGLVIREIKSKMAREYFAITRNNAIGPRTFWKKRCYDHNCRSRDTVIEKIEYCHKNPVRKGLVQFPGDYKWLSFNWYQGSRDVPLAMDEFDC
ncbi:MAG: hypothetical protein GY841_19310 [FCB group bacterium]|nr:hypothetical protein [FCB group bacterium]